MSDNNAKQPGALRWRFVRAVRELGFTGGDGEFSHPSGARLTAKPVDGHPYSAQWTYRPTSGKATRGTGIEALQKLVAKTPGTDLIVTVAKQLGAVVLPENDQWINRLQIKSENSSRLYIVAQRKTSGEWGCSCPGWKAHKHCKHLRTMMPALLSVGKREAVDAAH